MYRLSLESIFGVNATQDIDSLVISKSSLPSLTPSLNNRAEQLLIAICLQALSSFQGEIVTDDDDKIDIGGDTLSFDNSDVFEFLKMFVWKPFYTATSETEFAEVKQVVIQRFEVSGYEYED
ncbi:MAG: hypothetical protein RM347_009070 [Nostoc sp. ChiQUE02]|uniref:hypothetical protein n=1 Tax=Nostoc sp. ChiQUE02 TaxID=3075377 RepID=UPI002AD2A743|nr:hypothetical protein [Nostoc sp. ChiQUE02]MDZ8232900.1 hypothetical protein [Nostoc sp. ChiQUE02]